MLFDNHGRKIDYLRLAVTDRCNLRCFYCMPEDGIDFVNRSSLMTYEEMIRVVSLFAGLGIKKVRITGGEPFVRKDLLLFMSELSRIPGVEDLHLTTNGTLISKVVDQLKDMGVSSVNLSIDSLNKERFTAITRRDTFDQVMESFDQLLAHNIPTKLNMVVMAGKNQEDIIEMIELTKDLDISVRFLEEMPFNGEGKRDDVQFWNADDILSFIKSRYPEIHKLEDPPHSTSKNYKVPRYQGSFGIIASYSRLFCGTCNRIRLTPTGVLKTCLYDNGVFNIRDLIRNGASDEILITTLKEALGNRAKDGFEAEKRRADHLISESMATIGG